MKIIILIMLVTILSSCGKTALDSKTSTEANAITANNSACPAGYITISKLSPYTTRDFCVMKYEAKRVGNNEAVSVASGLPWGDITRDNSRLACKALGPKYDLISNEQWQTIARNIAGVASNWSGGTVANRELNIGQDYSSILPASDDDVKGNCSGTGQSCSSTSWNSKRRTSNLSNGNVIWDFNGNSAEWVSNDYWVSDGSNVKISELNTGDLRQVRYGAASNTICDSPTTSPFCGMGYAYLDLTRAYGALTRGWEGIFTVNAGFKSDEKSGVIGFRCVFFP